MTEMQFDGRTLIQDNAEINRHFLFAMRAQHGSKLIKKGKQANQGPTGTSNEIGYACILRRNLVYT
jgi:hypothetical protein